jgi:hypothetical protein
MDICRHVRPLLHQVGSVEVACHLYPDDAGQSRESASSAQEAR